ncbi:MAG: T9SS type A sorting domain-containing protein [Bacteroidia bacterium]
MKTKTSKTLKVLVSLVIAILSHEGYSQSTNCDDFTTYNWQPTGDTLGYTQSISPITNAPYPNSSQGLWELNQQNGNPGMYGVNSGALFLLNGSNQQVTYEMYAFYSQFQYMGFSVNGSAPVMLNNSFPVTISGVIVNIDTSAVNNVSNFENFYLSFSGNIDSIKVYTFESGILSMCVEPTDTTCNNFTTYNWQPTDDTLGYTQSIYPIISTPSPNSSQGLWELNQQNGHPGMYGWDIGAMFLFNGSNQHVTYEMYALSNQFQFMGFSVNGSTPVMLNNSFPVTISGVVVHLDTSATNSVNGFENFYLSFTGNIDSIKVYVFESGILSMCIEPEIANSVSEADELFRMNVYPNPTSQSINITNESIINESTIISLINVQGQEVIRQQINFNGFYNLNISSLNTGIYIVKIQNEKETYQSKVLIQR